MPLWFILSLLVAVATLAKSNKDVTVTIKNNSTLKGFLDEKNGVINFRGVPYAEPPLDKLRFTDPMPAAEAKTVLDCTQYGDSCIQPKNGYVPGNISENCLFLNIFTPSMTGSAPVMFFIHGGAFVSGAGRIYDGTEFAKEGVVLVNINYRLGVFGFYYDKENNITGNQGLKDQVLALKWVKDNIELFGGDPKRITIFGESAGSASVSHLVLSPTVNGVFQRAIMESGVANAAWGYMPPMIAQNEANEIKAALKCGTNDLGCVQKADVLSVAKAVMTAKVTAFSPTLDGKVVVDDPEKLITDGKYNDVSMIVGFNKNEGWLFIPDIWPEFKKLSDNGTNADFCTSEEIHNEAITVLADSSFPPADKTPCIVDACIQEYSNWAPPSTAAKRAQAIADFVTDGWFKIPSLEFARKSPRPVHVYLYDYVSNFTSAALGHTPLWMGAVHASELSMVFGMPFNPRPNMPPPTDADKSVSRSFMQIWSTYARNGTASWPEFNTTNEQAYVVIDEAGTTVNNYPRWNQYRFWNDYIPQLMAIDCKNKPEITTTTIPTTTKAGIRAFGFPLLTILMSVLSFVMM